MGVKLAGPNVFRKNPGEIRGNIWVRPERVSVRLSAGREPGSDERENKRGEAGRFDKRAAHEADASMGVVERSVSSACFRAANQTMANAAHTATARRA